ncbi:MAG: flavodoxin domain-containing protein [Candidatus Kappaea frigidicola]|nr:flavodoxin domain-containing protein [Candidatus Kappaea frigidicola]
MPTILVTYYSRGGNTKMMAEGVKEGIEAENVTCVIKPVNEVKIEELLDYKGIAIGSPTYYGDMAAEVKKLLDDSVKLHGQLEGKIGAAFSSSANIGGGNETTILSILRALLVHGMIIQGDSSGDHYGSVSIGSPDKRAKEESLRLGKRLAQLAKRLS